MKKQILTFIIGLLVGAILSTGVFLVLKQNEKPNMANFDRTNFPTREKRTSETNDSQVEESKTEEVSE